MIKFAQVYHLHIRVSHEGHRILAIWFLYLTLPYTHHNEAITDRSQLTEILPGRTICVVSIVYNYHYGQLWQTLEQKWQVSMILNTILFNERLPLKNIICTDQGNNHVRKTNVKQYLKEHYLVRSWEKHKPENQQTQATDCQFFCQYKCCIFYIDISMLYKGQCCLHVNVIWMSMLNECQL